MTTVMLWSASGSVLSLIGSAALLHSVWNVLLKKADGGAGFLWLCTLISALCLVPLGAVGAINGDAASDWRMLGAWSVGAWVCVGASALVHVAYKLTLQRGYRSADFSVVYPLARGVAPFCAVVGAALWLSDVPSMLGWLGCIAISVGVFCLSRSGASVAPSAGGIAGMSKGIGWGVGAGVCIAAYSLIDAWAIKGLLLPPSLYYAAALVLRCALLAPAALSDHAALAREWRRNWRYAIGVGVLSPLGYLLILFALQRAPLSVVAPLREVGMLFGVLLGAWCLREPLGKTRLIGAGAVMLGAMAISVGIA